MTPSNQLFVKVNTFSKEDRFWKKIMLILSSTGNENITVTCSKDAHKSIEQITTCEWILYVLSVKGCSSSLKRWELYVLAYNLYMCRNVNLANIIQKQRLTDWLQRHFSIRLGKKDGSSHNSVFTYTVSYKLFCHSVSSIC